MKGYELECRIISILGDKGGYIETMTPTEKISVSESQETI